MLGPDGDQIKVNFYENVDDNSQKSSFVTDQRLNITFEVERLIIAEDTPELTKYSPSQHNRNTGEACYGFSKLTNTTFIAFVK